MSAFEKEDKPGCAELTLVLLLALPVHIAFSAYVGMRLWAWGAVDAFGLPAVGYGHALVLAAFISWVKPAGRDDRPVESGALIGRACTVLLWHTTLLLVGYIGHRMVAA